MQATEKLEQQLGYHFRDSDLLEQALTHRSASKQHYERLEFLGDAILGQVISAALYKRFPQATEGELTRLRAQIVKGDSLARISRQLGLGDYIVFGPGELKSGSRRRSSILADVMESLIGAIYLDSDMMTVEGVILSIFDTALAASDPDSMIKDPKTRLQEFLQARSLELPEYEVEEVTGPAHKQHFKVHCRIRSMALEATGEGSSRKNAEQAAANSIYEQIAHG